MQKEILTKENIKTECLKQLKPDILIIIANIFFSGMLVALICLTFSQILIVTRVIFGILAIFNAFILSILLNILLSSIIKYFKVRANKFSIVTSVLAIKRDERTHRAWVYYLCFGKYEPFALPENLLIFPKI